MALGQRLHLVKVNHSDPYEPNHEAQAGLWALKDQAAVAVPDLIRMYDENPDPSFRASIVFELGFIGLKAKEAVPLLLLALTNSSDNVRLSAVSALWQTDTNATQVVPALITCLNDPSPEVQQRAIEELGEFGEEARTAAPALLQLLRIEKIQSCDGACAAEVAHQPHSVHVWEEL